MKKLLIILLSFLSLASFGQENKFHRTKAYERMQVWADSLYVQADVVAADSSKNVLIINGNKAFKMYWPKFINVVDSVNGYTTRGRHQKAIDSVVTSIPTLTSGTYTPTLTNVQNVSSNTAYACQYYRVGNVVTVSGRVDVSPTAGTTRTYLDLSLPIASGFTANNQAGGSASAVVSGAINESGALYANATDDRVVLDFYPAGTGTRQFYFTFTYIVIAP